MSYLRRTATVNNLPFGAKARWKEQEKERKTEKEKEKEKMKRKTKIRPLKTKIETKA